MRQMVRVLADPGLAWRINTGLLLLGVRDGSGESGGRCPSFECQYK